MGISSPKRDDIIKYNLWEECGQVCPYTGKHISQTALFGENPEFQIEHILPYDRSLDDSFVNKSLCHVHENIHIKRNQTPYEAYGHDEDKFEELKQRINRTAMPYWKKQKFWQKAIDTDKIIQRELNDTRYICREVVKYLKRVCRYVSGTRGKATSDLGYQWGLIKDRDDHRHHALDAAVVAVTEQKHLRELGKSKYSKEGIAFAPPWPNFREELVEKIKQINVSHRTRRKVSGQLHEETSYGLATQEKMEGHDIFVYRKKLEDLTIAMVAKIIDPEVRKIVTARLFEKGIDLSKSGKPPKDIWAEPLYMKTTKSSRKVPIKRVRITTVLTNPEPVRDASGNIYRYVKPGSNHHAEIWEYIGGGKKGRREAEIVSVFEAIRRSRRGKPVVDRNHGKDTKFVCSLAINDMVIMPNRNGESDLYRVQKMNVNKQIYFRHHTASTIDDESTLIRKQANLFNGRKVTIDPLGRVQEAND
jgi:CRISPR-associated endonuclease Csn1